jgi:hypothetical protein
MEAIETYEHAGLTVKILNDSNPESPREWDNLGTMACFHRRYNLGDKNEFKTPDELQAHLEETKAIHLPLYLYDHSGLTMNTTGFSCPWDSGQVGIIFVTPENIRKEFGKKRITAKLREKVKEILRAEVETFDEYLRGDVYGYVVEKDGNHLDSCWGFYGGINYCKEQANSAAENVTVAEILKV